MPANSDRPRKAPSLEPTTITLSKRTKSEVLDTLKVHNRETYDEELNRLLGPMVPRKIQQAVAAGGA